MRTSTDDRSAGQDEGSDRTRTVDNNKPHSTMNEKPASGGNTPEKSKAGIMSKLPVWLSSNLKNKRTWKTFVRCMIAFLATLVLLLTQSSMLYLGQAAFFGLLMALMIPPYMAVTLYAFALSILGIGMLFGWAWGCAAMAAATRARSVRLLESNYQTVKASFVSNGNIDGQLQSSIFHGDFLDPRSSAVYGAFLFAGTYFLGYIRARAPKLTLGCVFACIVLDIMCSYGPLIPNNRFTLAEQILLPAGCFMAIGIVTPLLIFPQTLNHIFTDAIVDGILRPAEAILDLQQSVLTTKPSDHDAWGALAEKVHGLRKAYITASTTLSGQVSMLKLEISHGRTSANKLIEIFDKCKELGARTFGLSAFMLIIDERHKAETARAARRTTDSHPTVRYDKLQEVVSAHEADTKRRLDDLVPVLESTSARLRSACQTVLKESSGWLKWTNARRWKRGEKAIYPTPVQVRQEQLAELNAALAEYRTEGHMRMLEPFRDLFHPETGDFITEGQDVPRKYMISTRSIFRCFVFSSNMISYAGCVHELGQLMITVDQKAPKSKLQFPTAIVRVALKVAGSKQGGGNPLEMGIPDPDRESENDDESTAMPEEQKPAKHNPDADAPTNSLQKFGRRLAAVGHFLVSPNGLFAFKFGLVSIVLWIPQVIPNSAWFTYTNKGLWALIMAQTALGVFAGEQITTFILRMGGTALGCILGVLAWYIGSGSGNGNPYGVAAATMVIVAPIMFLRIIAPPAIMVFFLLSGVTMMLIVGYGWVDNHQTVLGNQGAGVALAGRRALLVIIGFAAAFLIMLFPRPLSSKRLVRRSLARGIADLSDLYSREVTGFFLENEEDGDTTVDIENVQARQERYRAKFFSIFARFTDITTQIAFAKVEPRFQGAWPAKKYEKLHNAEVRILSTCGVLSGAYARLSPKWCKVLVRNSPYLNPNFVADSLLLMSVLHHSLQFGTPLPPTVSLLERLVSYGAGPGPSRLGAQLRAQGGSEQQEEETHLAVARPVLNWKMLNSDQIAHYATATVALSHLANAINELQSLVISLVGETEMSGFDQVQLERGHRDLEALNR